MADSKKRKKPKQIKQKQYAYNAEELKEKIKQNPNYKLNKAQLMLLYTWMTSNFIKHRTSPRCNAPMPHVRYGNKPFFIYNQVDAYLNNPRYQEDYFKEEREGIKGKIGKTG